MPYDNRCNNRFAILAGVRYILMIEELKNFYTIIETLCRGYNVRLRRFRYRKAPIILATRTKPRIHIVYVINLFIIAGKIPQKYRYLIKLPSTRTSSVSLVLMTKK